SALDSLAAMLPDTAEKVDDNGTVTVSPDELVVGDTVLIRPGGRVPADGEVVTGTADVDEAMITGASQPDARAAAGHRAAGAGRPPTAKWSPARRTLTSR